MSENERGVVEGRESKSRGQKSRKKGENVLILKNCLTFDE